MAETLLLPVLRGVIGKAADALVQTITRMCGVDDDREKLERRLEYVSRKLAHAEEKSETDPAVRTWMKALKAVAYKADDVLDHIQYEALRREAQGHRSTTSKVLSNFTRENPLLFRLKVSRELKDVLHKIDEVVEEMNKFSLLEHAEVPQISHPQTYSSLDESEEIYGRDDDKAVVVKLLLDQQNQEKVQVLPIIGMGGLGKTTLAKMVYNDIRVQNHFELKMWHCVSDNFEAPSILRSVIELATKCKCDLPENIELLRQKLLDVIGRKRFLLILDDVWNDDEYKWEDYLKPLLCSSIGGSGSMIVVTSRSQKVAFIMGTFPPHELACLSEEDSWKLFSKKAFSKGVQEREEFVKLGRCIVNKCKGLPLALRTMGGLMSSKQGVNEWVAIADSTISDTKRGKDDVMSILKLSYKYLSSEMKQCFAFCAIFPKDYEMVKDVLIQLWMANNFIHAEGTIDLTQKGEFIFNELVWRSFLQDVKEFGRISFDHNGYISYRQLIVKCKMHDLMHDLAKSATEECAFAEELTKKNASIKCVRHIKMSSTELRKNKGLLKKASSLRTLLTDRESRYKDIEELKLKSLRALRCMEPSHSLVKYSKYLQYLDLSGSHIVTLPDYICMMYNLQSLRLDWCFQLRHLPGGLTTSLRKLRHICLFRCDSLEEMPPKLSLLHNLRKLTIFVVGTKDGCGIEELKDLQHLGNRLELWELRKVESGSKPNLHEKQNLCELVLKWNHQQTSDIRTNDDMNNDEEILESLVPPSELKVLEVRGYRGLGISQWMRDPRMFEHLRTLIISDWPRCKDIPLIWLSTSLENLSLTCMDSLTTLCKSIDGDAEEYSNVAQVFPRLKSMTLHALPNLERWTDDRILLMFPRLETLRVVGCPKLATLPEGPILKDLSCRISSYLPPYSHRSKGFVPMSMPLANWPSLVNLEVEMLVNVDVSVDEQQGQSSNPPEDLRGLCTTGDDAFTSIFSIPKLQLRLTGCFSHVERFVISSLYNIVRWPVEELGYMPRLTTLSISLCKKLGEEGLSSEEILPLPLLKRLNIEYCTNLLEIPQLPLSLEILHITGCGRLVGLPSNLRNLAKLRGLNLMNCDALKALPDGMDGLTSLEESRIYDCPGIEEFPEGLLQRLPTLKRLNIEYCPALQRRCREGGEYFDLVSSIPKTDIGGAVEPTEVPPLGGGNSQLRCLRFWN